MSGSAERQLTYIKYLRRCEAQMAIRQLLNLNIANNLPLPT
jgi:hypothetical protein